MAREEWEDPPLTQQRGDADGDRFDDETMGVAIGEGLEGDDDFDRAPNGTWRRTVWQRKGAGRFSDYFQRGGRSLSLDGQYSRQAGGASGLSHSFHTNVVVMIVRIPFLEVSFLLARA